MLIADAGSGLVWSHFEKNNNKNIKEKQKKKAKKKEPQTVPVLLAFWIQLFFVRLPTRDGAETGSHHVSRTD